MFNKVEEFEKSIASFYGAPYAVAVDCCTHGIELCLRYTNVKSCTCHKHTYLSVPMTLTKLGIDWDWYPIEKWEDYYWIPGTNIIDAAVYWKENGYIYGTFMVLSFQFKKHLSLGRGGAILCQNYNDYIALKKMSYDGRLPNVPWEQQDVETMGYHYYMTPETAMMGLEKLPNAIATVANRRDWTTYPDLSKMKVFQC